MAKLHLVLDVKEVVAQASLPDDPAYFANGVLLSSFAGFSVSVDHAEWQDAGFIGKRVKLVRKSDLKDKRFGTIIADPADGETRFRTDDGEEVGAYQWYYSIMEGV